MKKIFAIIISSFLAIMPMPILAEDSQVTTLKYVVSAKVRYVTDNTTMDIADVQCGDTLKEPDNPQKTDINLSDGRMKRLENSGISMTLSKEI